MTNTVVRARIDEQVKEEAAAVLATIGLTVSDAFRLMMVRIANDKALPFEPLTPNAETIEAMKAARRGELTTVASPDQLLASLNAGDRYMGRFSATRIAARP
jgi:DNA-damage-inducible protein J